MDDTQTEEHESTLDDALTMAVAYAFVEKTFDAFADRVDAGRVVPRGEVIHG